MGKFFRRTIDRAMTQVYLININISIIWSVEQNKTFNTTFWQLLDRLSQRWKIKSDFHRYWQVNIISDFTDYIIVNLLIVFAASSPVRRKNINIKLESINACLLNFFGKGMPVLVWNTVNACNYWNINGFFCFIQETKIFSECITLCKIVYIWISFIIVINSFA